jgi:preprotein translocase subunit YajC
VEQFFPFILLALAILLLFVLPARQRKQMAAKAQAMQESLTIGTPVMTTSGLHGTVADLSDPATVGIEIAPGVVARFTRAAILEVRQPAVAEPLDTSGDDASGTTGGRPADGTL